MVDENKQDLVPFSLHQGYCGIFRACSGSKSGVGAREESRHSAACCMKPSGLQRQNVFKWFNMD